MKYFKEDLVSKCSTTIDDICWMEYDQAAEKYWSEFREISHNFPEDFCARYIETAFHDALLKKIEIIVDENKKGIRHLHIVLEDYANTSICYDLLFCNISSFSWSAVFDGEVFYSLLLSEILPVKNKRFSLSAWFGDHDILSCEFEKLRYIYVDSNTHG